MFPRCLPAFPPALNEGFHPGTQLDDPRPGQPLRVGIFTSHFFARCPLVCSPLACTQWSSGRFLRDGSSPVQHKASRPGAGTPFRPTPTGYLGNSCTVRLHGATVVDFGVALSGCAYGRIVFRVDRVMGATHEFPALDSIRTLTRRGLRRTLPFRVRA